MWTGEAWVEQIEDFRKNSDIGAVLVRIQSPGGVVAAAQEIYEAMKRCREKKPVVVSMGSVAASGGLYIAMGGSKIFADPGTITGSIGVKMEHLNLGDLLRFAKIEYSTIKSGEFKDIGTFKRRLTTEEEALIKNMIDEIQEQFKGVIVAERKLEKSKVDAFADGRIFTGAAAQTLGLVDSMGGMAAAAEEAAKLAGIQGEPKLQYPDKPTGWWMRAFLNKIKVSTARSQIYYLYD